MRALRSEQTQLRGTVSIWYGLGRFGNKAGNTGYADSYKAARALPLKKAATHICVDEMHQALLASREANEEQHASETSSPLRLANGMSISAVNLWHSTAYTTA